jgi:hypothetical protein
LNTMQQFGAVFGVAIVTGVFNSRGSLARPAAVARGYRPALATAAGLLALGAVTALGPVEAGPIGRPRRRETGDALEVRV